MAIAHEAVVIGAGGEESLGRVLALQLLLRGRAEEVLVMQGEGL